MKPLIGVLAAYNPDRANYVTRENYLKLLRDAGAAVVILPMSDTTEMDSMLDLCDGILLTGGDDVEPARYGEETLPCCGDITYERDAFEIPLIQRAAERDIPMFGICRGIQVLNVALGGSLYQDVAAQIAPSAQAHSQPEPYGAPTHSLTIVPDSPLNRLWKSDTMMVNSMHHQAIKRVADCLKPMAYAPEGFVEAVDMPGKLYIRAVQWHPEYMIEDCVPKNISEPQHAMACEFVEAVRKAQARK